MRYTIGVYGKMGSGKSLVCEILSEFGATIIDADEVGHSLYDDLTVRNELTRNFNCLDQNGMINPKIISAQVFSNHEALEKLNDIMHPAMYKSINQIVNNTEGLIALDCALLYEIGINGLCNEIWYVESDENSACLRAAKRDDIDPVQVKIRRAMQSGKMAESDKLISNSKDIFALRKKVFRYVPRFLAIDMPIFV